MANVAKRIGALPTSSRRSPARRWPRTVTAIGARRPWRVSGAAYAAGARALTANGPARVKLAHG